MSIKHVILFGVDGGGTFFEQTGTPCMDRWARRGAVCRRVLTERPTVSAECWGSMLHGVSCEQHRLTNWIASNVPYPVDSPYPSVFRAIREARPEAKLASFCDWNAINVGVIEEGLGVHEYTACDYALIAPAIEYIRENPDFTLMYFQFDSVDHNGHEYGYGSPEHLAAITANDCYMAKLVEALEENGLLEETLLMAEADHGGTPGHDGEGGGHGGDSDAEKYVFFAAAGPGVNHTELKDMIVRDTSPAILHALGIPQPASWTGRVPCGMFADLPGEYPRPAGLPQADVTGRAMPETGAFERTFADFQPLWYDALETPDAGTAAGKLYSVPGRVGRAVRFDDGALSAPCPALDEGFSLCGWIRLESSAKNAVIAANRPLSDACDQPGFALRVDGDYIALRMKQSGEESLDCGDFQRPASMVGRWCFFVCVADVPGGEVRFSLDFAPLIRWRLPEGRRMLPGGGTLHLGGDGTAECSRLPAELDDFCLCRKRLTEDDLARLKRYYQV